MRELVGEPPTMPRRAVRSRPVGGDSGGGGGGAWARARRGGLRGRPPAAAAADSDSAAGPDSGRISSTATRVISFTVEEGGRLVDGQDEGL